MKHAPLPFTFTLQTYLVEAFPGNQKVAMLVAREWLGPHNPIGASATSGSPHCHLAEATYFASLANNSPLRLWGMCSRAGHRFRCIPVKTTWGDAGAQRRPSGPEFAQRSSRHPKIHSPFFTPHSPLAFLRLGPSLSFPSSFSFSSLQPPSLTLATLNWYSSSGTRLTGTCLIDVASGHTRWSR